MTAADVRTLTAREARDAFLAEFGLDTAGYTSPDFPVHLCRGVTLRFRNPGLLPYHDLHHVATGFPATVLGEAQISAFELRAGVRSPLVRCLCLGAIALGLCRAPRLIIDAWRNSRGARTLYDTDIPYPTLLGWTVAELRSHLGLPPGGIAPKK